MAGQLKPGTFTSMGHSATPPKLVRFSWGKLEEFGADLGNAHVDFGDSGRWDYRAVGERFHDVRGCRTPVRSIFARSGQWKILVTVFCLQRINCDSDLWVGATKL